jgi:hypothetical protein
MKQTLTAIILLCNSILLYPQVILTIEGQEIIDTETGASDGYNILRSQPTTLTFRDNSLISVNSAGYMLQAGDEGPRVTNNNLDGEIISGNKFIWNGTEPTSWTHALFTGYNIGVQIKYNYLQSTPNGIQRKSNGMFELSGVVAYNILNNPKLGIAVKGINGIRIYNNTFYSDRTPLQTNRGLVDICNNTDGDLNAKATGTKVFNNIFYAKNKVFNIRILETDCLENFESDYNVFWCEAGDPIFEVDNETKSFAQWQALGYDLHSVVVNPNFVDIEGFVPAVRLDYGLDLGDDFREGLAVDATWNRVAPKSAVQNGLWQVGARIYAEEDEDEDEEEWPKDVTRIYPNPAKGIINILLTDLEHQYRTLKIFDASGIMVYEQDVNYGLNKIRIPGKFSAGFYSIMLDGENLESSIKKVILLN